MALEQAKIDSEPKLKAKETPFMKEEPEAFRQEIREQSEKEVVNFKGEGRRGLTSLEARATKEQLSIDAVDKQALVDLENEADAAKVELLEKLRDGNSSEGDVFGVDNQKDKKEIGEFSKRYSSFRRSEVASQIWRMRKEHQQKKKQIERQNVDAQEQKARINEELKATEGKIKRIEKVVSDLEQSVQEQKGKLWYKFANFFKKQTLDDENMLGIAREKLGQAQDEMKEKSEMLNEVREVVFESSGLEDAKAELRNFYNEQSEIKSKYESESEQRDLARISREKGVTFIHGLPLDNFEMNNTSDNNTIINTKEVDAQSKIQMILGLEPTLSTSTINESAEFNKGMMYPFGIILKKGEVVSAYQGDAGTEALNLYARRSKYDKGLDKSVIQDDISRKIDKAIEQPLAVGQRSEEGAMGMGFNELVVENPKVSALYVNLENTSSKMIDIDQVKGISERLVLPVVGLKGGKMFDLINGGKEITSEEASNLGRDLSPEEKLAMAENSIDTIFSSGSLAEAKRKLEELKKESPGAETTLEKRDRRSQEINLLDAKGIEFRSRIANWVENNFSFREYQDGENLIEAAKSQLKGDAPATIEALFEGKTKEECLELARKFKEDKNKLDKFFDSNDSKKYRIKF